jgi:hypothetical protein
VLVGQKLYEASMHSVLQVFELATFSAMTASPLLAWTVVIRVKMRFRIGLIILNSYWLIITIVL